MPTYFNSVSLPTDNGSQAGPTLTFSNPPISNMLPGDLVVVSFSYRSATAPTLSVSNSGGQTWNGVGAFTGSGTATLSTTQIWCVFNGTWSAAPVFTITSGTLGLTGVMVVFRPNIPNSDWAITSNNPAASFAAPSSPFTVSASGFGFTNGVQMVYYTTDDDNTWGSLSGTGWAQVGTQFRNLQGSDTSIAIVYYLNNTGASASSPTVSLNQATLGGDPGFAKSTVWVELPPKNHTLKTSALRRSNTY